MIKHLDLFSGIGGFALAVDAVWGKENVEHIFCEIDPFCTALLAKRFEGSVMYGDIRTIGLDTDTDRNGCTRQREEVNTDEGGEQALRDIEASGGVASDTEGGIDILTGGFPCQPFSQAGVRKGRDDERHLWPEMLRVIRLTQPRWVIAENVRGLLTIEGGLAFEQVCLDLEASGYTVQAFVIPACAVNAPHRRDRVWIVACNSSSIGRNAGECDRQGGSVLPVAIGQNKESQQERDRRELWIGEGTCDVADGECAGLEGSGREGQGLPGQQDRTGGNEGRGWEANWLEVATELCRVDDGISAEFYCLAKGIQGGYYTIPGGEAGQILISKARHRVERLKALGHSIVPKVAIEIMRAIRACDEV